VRRVGDRCIRGRRVSRLTPSRPILSRAQIARLQNWDRGGIRRLACAWLPDRQASHTVSSAILFFVAAIIIPRHAPEALLAHHSKTENVPVLNNLTSMEEQTPFRPPLHHKSAPHPEPTTTAFHSPCLYSSYPRHIPFSFCNSPTNNLFTIFSPTLYIRVLERLRSCGCLG
jgi:hypothetical protein